MITFLDENDVEYGALATIKATNAVNGERSLTGTIVSGDYVLSNIERGWRLRFDDEYFVVTYAKPVDEGRDVQVEFDAVHQFFWDFDKSSVYDQLADGSHTFVAYLDFIFKNSGYSYTVDSALNVYAFEKQSFGFKKRLTLFNDIITSTGVEFQVNGKVVRILAKVGTDLSTVVRKNFNMNELTIEKNIGDFVTYQKGFGAYFDEEDHSKGRLEVEYTSPLASVYGKLEAEPFVDERYSQSSSLLAVLKENVDNSYSISVSLDMEDLTRAGYKYKQPVAGDYIMAINETLDFQEKIRIVSFTSEYDVDGQLIKHTVTCNDIGSVKKLSASYNLTKKQASSASATANNAYSVANKALISADGKNTNYYGDSFPVDNPKGTLKKGDLLFLTVGDTVKQYYWNGADWIINPVLDDVEAFKEQIAEELKDVPNREEFENKIAEELATSKAEIETQIETAKTQAESNAKEYADTINQETAKVAELANAAADEIKADLVNVKNNLTSTSLVANNAQAAADAAKQELTAVNTKVDNAKAELTQAKQDLANVASELNTAKQDLTDSVTAVNNKVDNAKEELTQAKQQLTTVSDDLSKAKTDFQNAVSAVDTKATNLKSDLTQAKQDLNSQAQQLQAQANAQSELTKRVSTVEKTANGTKTTVSELSKTVAQNGKDITSVTARTKVVEDDLSGTKTTLSQVKTTADSTSQKTATLETGLNGLNAKFDNLKVGSVNLLKNSKTFTGSNIIGQSTILNETYQGCTIRYFKNDNPNSSFQDYAQYLSCVVPNSESEYTVSFWAKGSGTTRVFFYIGLPIDSFVTSQGVSGNPVDGRATFTLTENWQRYWVKYKLQATAEHQTVAKNLLFRHDNNSTEDEIWLAGVQLEEGNIATDYSPNEADLEQKVAEYKQNADQNYASLQTTVQNLDGTVQQNKTTAEQTAAGFKTRIESLETYKGGESERANAYFESAKTETAKQLTAERTAIAKDYVAKSTYTSDVTGIRNELSATTSTANATKTNLANYQTSNDKMVASLKSSLQTTDGNVSNLQTKVEAVPGQITSAVSAIEGKIPTEIGAVNLLKNSKSFTGSNIGGSGTILSETYQGCAVRHLKVTGEVPIAEFIRCVYPKLGGEYVTSFWAKGSGVLRVYFHGDSGYLGVASGLTSEGNATNSGDGLIAFNLTSNWKRYWVKYKLRSEPASATSVGKHLLFRTPPNGSENEVYLAGAQLEEGNVVSGYEPAPEDTAEQISSLSSQIKQTADGITLLATKTELNTAKNELQSGINTATNKANAAQNTANNNAQTISTHTTQISALNTGLQAKVSQTDFNTLSGRVTTAENNITAKANELSSKITSVEGKIPTSIGGRNYLRGTSDKYKTYTSSNYILGYANSGGTWDDMLNPLRGKTVTVRAYIKNDTDYPVRIQIWSTGGGIYGNLVPAHEEGWSVGTGKMPADWTSANVAFTQPSSTATGGTIKAKEAKLEIGNIPTDWSPAPEDTATQISNLSSEIKQTADGMTLLATKTELNTAKNDLQSGINTATNKANNAQSTANSNAQTISTHTTQISALNTGLSAKVSQTDFNTLSGRVTTAENNITAKANELSSKITSVESKIPTSIGARNYIRNYGLTATGWGQSISGWSFEIIKDSTAKSGQYLKATCTKAGRDGFFKNLFDFSDGRFFGKQMTWAMDVKTSKNAKLTIGCEWGNAVSDVNTTENWQRFSKTFKVATSSNQKAWIFYGSNWNAGDIVYIRDVQLEDGSIATSPVPAIEDTASDISTLSSQIKQTADGMTLLATKTELNTAKSDLQSGINTATNKANTAQSTANSAQSTANSAQNKANSNEQTISTHTTQISALNTGLSAKVSQTDFNMLSGRVTTAENNITAKANELSSKITSVEGKIPTSVGGRNYLRGTSDKYKTYTSSNYILGSASSDGTWDDMLNPLRGKTVTIRVYIKNDTDFPVRIQLWSNVGVVYGNTVAPHKEGWSVGTGKMPSDWASANVAFTQTEATATGGTIQAKEAKLEIGNIPSDWSPAPEDTANQISNLSSEIKQTADGITLLATKTELNTAKNDLQSGVNTATNKADAAQSTANSAQNTANSAQNKANSNAQTISTHATQISALNTGLQAKVSQSDFNTLSGRVTSAENNITAKANELSSKISSVEGKLPSGEMNLVEYGRPADGYSPYAGAEYTTHGFYYNGAFKMYIIKNTTTSEKTLSMNRFKVERNTEYTLYFKGFNNWEITNMDVWFLKRVSRSTNDFDSAQILVGGRKLSNGAAENISVTFNTGEYDEGYLRFDNNGTTSAGTRADLYFGDVSVKKGKSNNGWSPSLAELASSQDLKSAQSEIKQTTDAIKASVSSVQTAASNAQSTANTAVSKADAAQAGVNTLDSTTVKSASLTINADGIVMKAGKSTTDVANAIGSYFAVNQNAINLFSDKINVKGNMIVNGAITSDKIASKSINTAHLNGKIITADVIATNAITADAIKAGAVTTDKMSANSINGDRIAAGTLDAAKIKAGSITASQIASGTITSNQIKAGGISSANIAAGAITGDKIAAGAIDANKIAANAISANMITGGKLNSTNGATSFDLNAGTLTFNNDYGYIQRVASDKVFEITTYLGKDANSRDYLTSDFTIRKSDNSRQAGAKFTLYNPTADKPTAQTNINTDTLILSDSKNTPLFAMFAKTSFGNIDTHGWGDIPLADFFGSGLLAGDIAIGGHRKSLKKIVEELCDKAGIWWL